MLKIQNLTTSVDNKEVLKNFSIVINDGEIHTIMGKNGIGKSSLCKAILNHPLYHKLNGKITFDEEDITNLDTSTIAKKGIFLLSQNPVEIEGVTNAEMLRNALREKIGNVNIFEFNKQLENACELLELDKNFIHKEINVGASGGQKKKIELLHLAILKPKLIILDELDSGLDVDALKIVTEFINNYYKENKCSILMITHHSNILNYIKPTYVHIMDEGKIIKTGDISLAEEIEKIGFNGAK